MNKKQIYIYMIIYVFHRTQHCTGGSTTLRNQGTSKPRKIASGVGWPFFQGMLNVYDGRSTNEEKMEHDMHKNVVILIVFPCLF